MDLKEQVRKNLLLKALEIHVDASTYIHSTATLDSSEGIGCIRVGKGCEILHGCLLMTYGGKITIGENCSINPYTIIYGHGEGVLIGNNVLIASHSVLIPSNHNFSRTDVFINQQGETSKGIVIEDDVWIAARCTILDGVRIGKGSVIAAGSVVTRSIDPYTVVGGVPAKILKRRIM